MSDLNPTQDEDVDRLAAEVERSTKRGGVYVTLLPEDAAFLISKARELAGVNAEAAHLARRLHEEIAQAQSAEASLAEAREALTLALTLPQMVNEMRDISECGGTEDGEHLENLRRDYAIAEAQARQALSKTTPDTSEGHGPAGAESMSRGTLPPRSGTPGPGGEGA